MANELDRRQAICAGLVGAAAVVAPGVAHGLGRYQDPYRPFRVGIQSYSLRAFPFDKALELTQRLGLRYWEGFQNHVPISADPAARQAVLAALKEARVVLDSWGVQGFDGNEQSARRVFEFARAMGIRTISADPSPDALDLLDRLVQEYKVNIAIHNHGPGSRYDKISSVENALRGRHPRMGACIDTGHFLRSGEDPVEAIRRLGKRVHGVHLKDVKDKTLFTEVGKGDLDTVGLFRELRKLRYNSLVALEYEEHPDDPGPHISICLQAMQDAVAKSARI